MTDPTFDAEHQAILDSLVNPLAEEESKFEFDKNVQRHILGAILTDPEFLVQSRHLIKFNYFVELAHQQIYSSVTEFYDRYEASPHFFYVRQNLAVKARDEAQKIYYLAELESIRDFYVPGLAQHRQFLLDEITTFAKTEAMRIAFSECAELIFKQRKPSRETWQKVGAILDAAQIVEVHEETWLDYFNTLDERFNRAEQDMANAERFTAGFPSIDEAITGGGLSIGEVGAWIGTPGSGKSLALVKGAVANMRKGKKVLFISLEMAQDKIAARFDAQLAKHNIGTLIEKKDVVIEALKEFVNTYEDTRRLIIKQFPSGEADVNTIKACHQQLKMRGFHPDLVVVDYIGEMKDIQGLPIHESREKIIKQLRAFGTIEKHCTLTAVQPNRSAKDAQENNKYIDDAQLGDSYNQFRPLDAFWSINQTQQEKDEGIGRIFVIKHRDGRSKFGFELGYDYGPGKCMLDGVGSLDMFEITKDMYFEKMNQRRENDAQNTVIDNIPLRKKNLGNVGSEDDLKNIIGND